MLAILPTGVYNVCMTTETTAVTVRFDKRTIAQLDHLVAYMRTKAEPGMKVTRSDAMRYIYTHWAIDHGEAIDALAEKAGVPPRDRFTR